MKIAIDIRVLMDAQYSGVAEYVACLLKALLDQDRDNEYLLFYNSASPVTVPDFEYPNVRIIARHWPNKLLNYGAFKILNRPTIEALVGEPFDLWFMPHLNFISQPQTCRSILTVHDLSFLRYPEFFSHRKNLWHRAINAPKLIRNFDTVVAVSESTREDIIDLCGISAAKTEVIYGGVSACYRPIENNTLLQDVARKYDLPKKFILYLGNLEPRKNLIALIKAFNELYRQQKELSLVIAGAKGWCYEEIFASAKNSRASSAIKFLGYVSSEDKPTLYNLASVFAFPSFYEGFGFPPLEAMACGTPVVVGWGSSLSEVVGNAGLTVNPYDVADITTALELLVTDEALARQKSTAGIIQATKFNWTDSAKKYLQLFNE